MSRGSRYDFRYYFNFFDLVLKYYESREPSTVKVLFPSASYVSYRESLGEIMLDPYIKTQLIVP